MAASPCYVYVLSLSIWSIQILWIDAIGPHHLVVLVLDDVTMPDELPGHIEFCPDACDLARVSDNRILQTHLPGFRQSDRAAELDRLHRLACFLISYIT